jgi:hypothetical protein
MTAAALLRGDQARRLEDGEVGRHGRLRDDEVIGQVARLEPDRERG